MDAFQGCYKFEPYDCRYWAAFYLFLRITVLAVFAFTQGTFSFFVVACGILFIPVIILTAITRPYRQSVYNVIDIVIFLAFIQVCFSATGIALVLPGQSFIFAVTMFLIGIIIPLLYITHLAVRKILPNTCIVRVKELALHHLYFNNQCYKGGIDKKQQYS